jgi:hypothetical protein
MPTRRTELTEIVTGLATMGFPNIERALEVQPRGLLHVGPEQYEMLTAELESGKFDHEFSTAWANGVAFAEAQDGLRGRPPWSVEWKGNHKPPGYEQIPADLRIDHVYLISCKYRSKILHNASPDNLFVRLLADRVSTGKGGWYQEIAPDAYQMFYEACRDHLGRSTLPARITDLDDSHVLSLRSGLPRRLTGALGEAYTAFSQTVARKTAHMWRATMATSRKREEMLWRLLRLESAPYFVLGESVGGEPLRYRVATPWDFRLRYVFHDLTVAARSDTQQPVIEWTGIVRNRSTETFEEVSGHVEVRWSHGRFGRSPEAKVYLNTGHHDVPGYLPLDATPSGDVAPMRLFD